MSARNHHPGCGVATAWLRAPGVRRSAWVASALPTRLLVGFVALMALAELVTTVVFLDELHDQPGLIGYGAVGLLLAVAGTRWLATRGPRLFGFVAAARGTGSGALGGR